MLRIGLMLDSFVVEAWVAKIIDDIQKSDFAEISLVVLNTPPAPVRLPLGKRMKARWKRTAFVRYSQWDYHRTKGMGHDSHAEVDVKEPLSGVPVLKVEPARKGFTDRFKPDDVEAIRAADLDVMFRFGFRIIRGDVLDTARSGVWSFHHDDNLEYRGGPPLFWEIYEGNHVSGTILQRLTDSLDGGRVLYRGHSSTDFSSLHLNRNPIYWKTAEYAMRRLRDLHERGFEYIESLPTYNEPNNYSKRIYHSPDTIQMARFFARKLWRTVRGRVRLALGKVRPQWFLALRRRTPEHLFDDSTGYRIVKPQRDRFYADPFLLAKDGKTFLFLEDFRYAEGKAVISCAEVNENGELGEIVEVLRRPYHLSYPGVFEENGEIYMIPETMENGTVELYRAEEFPYKWKLDSILMENIQAVDTTIFKRNDMFWLFMGISNGRYSNNDELAIYFAPSLHGPWKPHAKNPVISDVRRSRPAGPLFWDNGRLIRPSQDCAKNYGYALNFFEVVTLTEDDYDERPVGRVEPAWVRGNQGTHAYSRTDQFEVIDGNFAIKPHYQTRERSSVARKIARVLGTQP